MTGAKLVKNQLSYSTNLDTIIALTTHLALTKWKSRTPSNMAKALGLERADVEKVLDNFKGCLENRFDKTVVSITIPCI